ncbi:MAG: ABC transporter ATP-binding protein [Mycoplasmatales bacterium]
MNNDIVLEVKNLSKTFKVTKPNSERTLKEKILGGVKEFKAVDNVSFTIKKGEIFGLVGESGSGKSTVARTIIKLYNVTNGKMNFLGQDITKITKTQQRALAKDMQMIFQDPFASVNPRMTVEEIIGEGLKIHQPNLNKKQIRAKVVELLKKVGLSEYHISRYPHEFSGGQLQRIGIARSLAVKPKFIIADESISALDVSIQAQVVNLLKDLKDDFGLTYLFIAHDLAMMKYISDKIGVMYKGKLVEVAPVNEIYTNPIHPYTKSLLSAIPHADPIYESQRIRQEYNAKQEHNYDYKVQEKTPEYHKLNEEHIVYCTKQELNKWTSNWYL